MGGGRATRRSTVLIVPARSASTRKPERAKRACDDHALPPSPRDFTRRLAVDSYSLKHLTDSVLDRELPARYASHRVSTAEVLAWLAEYDERKLYRPAGYASMFAYCVGQLGMSDDEAAKRIHAARTALAFPILFPAIADGQLNLSAVLLLKPRLAAENADELIAAASHRTIAELRLLLAERF